MMNATIDIKERSVASQLPYSQQISPTTSITEAGDFTSSVQIHGLSFDTMNNDDLDGFNNVWLNAINSILATPNHAVWAHIVRSKTTNVLFENDYDNEFSAELAKQYEESLRQNEFLSNRLYVSPVMRLAGRTSDRLGMKTMRKSSNEYQSHLERAKGDHERMMQTMFASLRRYHPQQLKTYTNKNGLQTRLGEFYSHLLNNEATTVPLLRANLSRTIQRSILDFGSETIRISNPGSTKYAAILTLVSPYTAEKIDCKAMETLLKAPFEFVLSQSFTTMPIDSAERLLKAQLNRIKTTANNELQMEDIRQALEQLQANKFKMLEHEWILVVYGDSPENVTANVNEAVQQLTQKSIQVSREQGGPLIATFYSIFPGAFRHGRIRKMPITSANMAKFFPMHNFPTGNRQGSQWGNPLLVLSTESKNPYYFNFHVSRDRLAEQGIQYEYDEEDGKPISKGHRKEIGNYYVVGESGSGKTTAKAALRAALRRQATKGNKPVKIFTLDKDNSEEIVMRAMGAEYFILQPGKPIEINPFQWGDDERTKQMIFDLAKWAATHDGSYVLKNSDYNLLKQAIADVFEFPIKERRFGLLTQVLPNFTDNGLSAALSKWCNNPNDPEASPYRWVLDSPTDRLNLDGATAFGFDLTAVFDLPYAKAPIMQMITEKIARSAVGTPHVIDIAEAWKALSEPLFASYIEDKSRTIRKQDGIIGLDTQNVTDITESKLGRQFLDQFPTGIILPNRNAKEEVYIEGLNCTRRELEKIKNARPELGEVLIKKGNESIIARMNFSGMNDMLSVLSSTPDNVQLCRELVKEYGRDPKIWLPHFYKRRHN